MDVEQASAQIDVLIERRASQKDEANQLEVFYAESVRRYNEQRRRENKALWYEHYCRMSESHRKLSEDYEPIRRGASTKRRTALTVAPPYLQKQEEGV